MRERVRVIGAGLCVGLGVLAGLAQSASAQSFTIGTQPVVSGLTRPVAVTAPNGDLARLFILEQRVSGVGRIRVVNLPSNTLNAAFYLSISGLATGNEQGLLGLAFHPNFMNNGYFYVYYNRSPETGISAGSNIVARYRANAPYATSTTADPASATILLTVPKPDANHNGGWMSFGPDGLLYIAMGDGGNGNDTNSTVNPVSVNPPGHTPGTGNAQDVTSNLLGKILRIDVDGADNVPGNDDDDGILGSSTAPQYTSPPGNPFNGTNGDREIFLYGVRNPWRNAFDRETGDLWIADVGQDNREEVNFIPAGQGAGFNMGWRCMEGTRCTGLTGCTCNAADLKLPIIEYVHTGTQIPPISITGGCAITGGYVYRGTDIPCLRGHYIFADYCSGDIYTFRRTPSGAIVDVVNRKVEMDPAGTATLANVITFGEDARGEMYIADQTGGDVYKIVASGASGADCNHNGVPDFCDISGGTSLDRNNNGVPDECECDPDFNQDGNVDQDDVAYLINVVGGGANPSGRDPDFNHDGNTDQDDIAALINTVGGGGCP